MRRFLEYMRFWWASSNQHGVHSPFVYNWVTKGLYKKEDQWKHKAKQEVFLERLVAYFEPHKLSTDVSDWQTERGLQSLEALQPLLESIPHADVVYCNHSSKMTGEEVLPLLDLMHNEAFLVVDLRQSTPELRRLWAVCKNAESATVTIDFYYFGLVFVRREQLKEHFTIRI